MGEMRALSLFHSKVSGPLGFGPSVPEPRRRRSRRRHSRCGSAAGQHVVSWRELHLLHDLGKDLIGLTQSAPAHECVCHCPSSAATPAGACAALERLLEKQLEKGSGGRGSDGLELNVRVFFSFGLLLFCVGFVAGVFFSRRARVVRGGHVEAASPSSVEEDTLALRVPRSRGRGVLLRA